jgi:hypothetical protein
MGKVHFVNLARIAVLLCAAAVLMPATAAAGGHRRHGCVDAPAEVHWAPTIIDPSLGAFPYPAGDPWCYAVPIQAVYQFPARIANQPGSDVGYLQTSPAFGLLGGRPYLYHP